MGYFSNGTEGEDYVESYCSNCIHDTEQDCPVWNAHLMFNGKGDEAKAILDMLIPRSKNGLYNKQCIMFVRKAAVAGPAGGEMNIRLLATLLSILSALEQEKAVKK